MPVFYVHQGDERKRRKTQRISWKRPGPRLQPNLERSVAEPDESSGGPGALRFVTEEIERGRHVPSVLVFAVPCELGGAAQRPDHASGGCDDAQVSGPRGKTRTDELDVRASGHH